MYQYVVHTEHICLIQFIIFDYYIYLVKSILLRKNVYYNRVLLIMLLYHYSCYYSLLKYAINTPNAIMMLLPAYFMMAFINHWYVKESSLFIANASIALSNILGCSNLYTWECRIRNFLFFSFAFFWLLLKCNLLLILLKTPFRSGVNIWHINRRMYLAARSIPNLVTSNNLCCVFYFYLAQIIYWITHVRNDRIINLLQALFHFLTSNILFQNL